MGNFRGFLKDKNDLLLFGFFVNILLIIIFKLFGFEIKILMVTVGLVNFCLVMLLTISFIKYNKELETEQKLTVLKKQYNELYDDYNQLQSDLEEYFLLWVHQIKTPITSLQLMVQNQDQIELPVIKQELINIENYANMAMSYLKLLSPGQDMDFAQVDLDQIIKEQLRKFSVWFIHDKIQLIYHSEPHWVLTDARWTSIQLEQVLSNAVKYAKGKSIEIYFDSQEECLLIKDTGVGISSTDLPKVFERGYSGFNGQLNEKSSGIGLYIVNSIAQKLQQPVTIDSQLGHGTQVSISFNKEKLTDL